MHQIIFIYLINCRERKRDAESLTEEPESKRLRLSEAPSPEDTPAFVEPVETTTTTTVLEATAEPEKAAQPKKKVKDNSSGNGGFKENPYTFLSPEDPILCGCM